MTKTDIIKIFTFIGFILVYLSFIAAPKKAETFKQVEMKIDYSNYRGIK